MKSRFPLRFPHLKSQIRPKRFGSFANFLWALKISLSLTVGRFSKDEEEVYVREFLSGSPPHRAAETRRSEITAQFPSELKDNLLRDSQLAV